MDVALTLLEHSALHNDDDDDDDDDDKYINTSAWQLLLLKETEISVVIIL